jgi:hypothetical protein
MFDLTIQTSATRFAKLVTMLLVIVLVLLPTAGCSQQSVVQQALTVFTAGQQYVAAAQSLAPELQVINPELAKEVAEYADLAGKNLASLIAIANAYLAKPDAQGYQALLNGVDALTASIDQKVLAAAKISNPGSQAKVMAILAVAATSAHVVLGALQAKASKGQVQAMPKIAGRVAPAEIRPYLDRAYADQMLADLGYGQTERHAALEQFGF